MAKLTTTDKPGPQPIDPGFPGDAWGPVSTNDGRTPLPADRQDQRVRGLFARVSPLTFPGLAFRRRRPPPGTGDDSWADGKAIAAEDPPAQTTEEVVDYVARRQAIAIRDAMQEQFQDFKVPEARTTFQTIDASSFGGYPTREIPWPFGNETTGRGGFGHLTIENTSNIAFNVYVGEVKSGIPYTIVPAAPSVGGFVLKSVPVRNNARILTLVPIGFVAGTSLGQVSVFMETIPRTASFQSYSPPTAQGTTQPTTATAVPANAANVVVKTGAGRLFSVTVTATGANPLTITDGVGGAVIFALPATPALGTYPANVPFNTSLVVVGSATNPAITVAYS